MKKTQLVYGFAGALFVICIVPIIVTGNSEPALRWAIARSVDMAIPCFIAAFSARPLLKFWPNRFTRWLMRNRRYLGIGWGIGFLLHGALLLLLARTYPEPFLSGTTPEAINHGILAFSVTALMLMTSNNWSVRTLGSKLWSFIHTLGGYFLLLTLLGALLTNLDRFWLWPYGVLTVGLILLRIAAAIHRLWRRPGSAGAQ